MFTRKGDPSENSSRSNSRSGTATKEYPDTSRSTGSQGTRTRITIKFDVGFNNTLFIRGNFASLNWNKGVPMKNVKADEWVWESDKIFPAGEFKVLINDTVFEVGPNHQIQCGTSTQFSPKFGE